LPPFVASVGLFVNATTEQVQDIVRQVPLSMLQFHGDETVEQCCAAAHAVNRPFMRAVRIGPELGGADLLKCEEEFRAASDLFAGLLLDALVDGYGGGGKAFDWSVIPAEIAPRIVLSGGLDAQNVADAVRRIRPFAVDVSSGIEQAKGVKDPLRMRAFVEAVRSA
jgi:phosphoribosylanthranilate isomerase